MQRTNGNGREAPLRRAAGWIRREGFCPATEEMDGPFTVDTEIDEVINAPPSANTAGCFFPSRTGTGAGHVGELRLTWYNNIDPDETVEIVNTLWQRANAGETVFYDIYTEREKRLIRIKRIPAYSFFRGEPGAKFAVCNAGGGFAYVGAMQDSFPHALELSQKGLTPLR